MPTDKELLYNDYKATMRKIADVKYATAVYNGTRKLICQPKGAHFRGRQLSYS